MQQECAASEELGPRSKTALAIHVLGWFVVTAGMLATYAKNFLPEERNGFRDMGCIVALVFVAWSGVLARNAAKVREINWASTWLPRLVAIELALVCIATLPIERMVMLHPWTTLCIFAGGVAAIWYWPVANWWKANYKGPLGTVLYALFGWAAVSGTAALAVLLIESHRW